jgi:hypothetical protein
MGRVKNPKSFKKMKFKNCVILNEKISKNQEFFNFFQQKVIFQQKFHRHGVFCAKFGENSKFKKRVMQVDSARRDD